MRTLRTFLLTCLTLALSVSIASAQGVSEYMPYQGFLADSTGAPVDGTYNLTFKLYEASDSQTALWEETIQGVTVTGGAFAVSLGGVSPNMKSYMTDGRAQYLSVAVNGESVSPRQRIGSQAYAYLAYNASRFGGYEPAHFATLQQLNELTLQAGAGLTEAQVNALIDLRDYLSETEITTLINQLIDARGYVTTNDVNNLIDARGYVTATEVQNLINTAVANATTTLQQQIDNLQTQITNVQNNGTAVAEILGVSNTSSDGKFDFNGQQGVRAATEMCKASFANVSTAHLCSSDEVRQAISTGNFDASIDDVTTWAAPNHVELDAETCQNFLYDSGDVAQGTTIRVDINHTSNGGGGNATGPVVFYARGQGCGTARQVLCCR